MAWYSRSNWLPKEIDPFESNNSILPKEINPFISNNSIMPKEINPFDNIGNLTGNSPKASDAFGLVAGAEIGMAVGDKLLGGNKVSNAVNNFVNDPSGSISSVGDKIGQSMQPGTQTSTTVPWAGQQPYLLDTFQRGQNLMNDPNQSFPGQSTDTVGWQNAQRSLAGNNPFMAGPNSADKRLTSISGQNMPGSYANLSYGAPSTSVDTGGYANVGYNPGAVSDAETPQYLRELASGKMMNGNPYLDKIFERMATNVSKSFTNTALPGINTSFGAKGRYGSNAHQSMLNTANEGLANTLAGTAADIYGKNYDLERGYMQDAIGRLGDVNANNLNRGLNSSQFGANFGLNRQNAISDVLNRNADRGLNSAQFGATFGLDKANSENQAFSQNTRNQLDAIGMMPDIRNMQYQDAGALRDVGASIDKYSMDKTMFPWEQLDRYSQIVNGNYGGTTTSPGPSQFDTWLGRGSKLANIALPFGL